MNHFMKRRTKPEPILHMDTEVTEAGDIIQTVRNRERTEVLKRWEMSMRDAGIRQALINLGWTPPPLKLVPDVEIPG